jgi:hypothetical protein
MAEHRGGAMKTNAQRSFPQSHDPGNAKHKSRLTAQQLGVTSSFPFAERGHPARGRHELPSDQTAPSLLDRPGLDAP